MAFKYLFELNGMELQDVSIGATAIEKFEEPLDEGSLRLPFTIRNYEYEMLGYLKITIEDGNSTQKILNFLIISDEVNEGSKYGEFIHEITIVEYTHKYDKYLVHSLAKTKAIKDNNPAKFLYNKQTYMNYSNGSNRFYMRIWIPPIEVKSSYYSDETITFSKVSNGIQATTPVSESYYNFDNKIDVYLKINTTRFLLSSSGASITLPAGNYEFEYGFVGVSSYFPIPVGTDTWLYKYQVRIIDRESISVLDALKLIRNTVSRFGGIESKLYFENTRMFNIDPSIESKLASIELPQTYIQKATLRQVLNSIFLYVNAVSRLYNDETNEIDLLSMDEFNKITGSFTMSDIAGYSTSQEANQLGSKGVSWLERLLPDNRENPNIIEPSGNQFKTVRSNNIQITQDKFGLELSKTLYEPKKFEAFIHNVKIKEEGLADPLYRENRNFIVDLTPRFINKDEWLIKDQTTDFPTIKTQQLFDTNVGMRENKVANIFWQQNSKYIELSDVFGYIWKQTLVQNVINEAINEQLTRNPFEPIIDKILSVDYMVTYYRLCYDGYIDGVYSTDETAFSRIDWRYQQFNLEYITQENSTVEVDRQDLTYLDYYSELRQNQSDKLINVELASRKSYGDLQRSGVPNRTFKKYHTDLSSIYNIGSEDDEGFVITKRKFEFHNNYIVVTYNATKDHNRLSQYIGLQQEYRWSEIPQTNQIFERIEPYRDYVFITKPNVLLIEETTKIANDYTMKLLFGNLINDWENSITGGKTKVTSAYLRTLEFLEEYPDDTYKYAISNPVNSFAKKGGLVFQFGFENNQIALSAVKEEGANRYNKAIRYTDDLGNMEEMWFQLSREYDISTSDSGWTEKETNDNYPLIRTSEPTGESYANFGSLNQMAFISGPSTPTLPTYDALIIYKDKSQNIKIPYQLNVIPYDYKTYVIGQEFYNENFLVKNPKQKEYQVFGTKTLVYIYDEFTPYGIFDDLKIKSGYNKALVLFSGVNVEIDTTEKTFRFLSTTLTDVLNGANWAIGDELGNLYLACNENLEGFNFFKKHFIQNLLEIGNRKTPNLPITYFDELIIEATVIGEIQHILATSMILDGTIKIDLLDPVEAQDEYGYNELKTEYKGFLLQNSINFLLSSDIQATLSKELGEDYYGSKNINTQIKGGLSQTSLDMILEGNLLGNVVNENYLDYQSLPNIYTQISGNLIQSNLEMILEGNISTTLFNEIKPEYMTNNVLFGNIKGELIQTRANMVLQNGLKVALIPEVYAPIYTWTPIPDTIPNSSPSTICDITNIGKIKCDSYCEFVGRNLMFSLSDLTNNPECGDGVEKWTCVKDGKFWQCTVYEGIIKYENCLECKEVLE